MHTPKKIAVAYSGGLDTSVIIPWLKERYGCEVVAVVADVGQGAHELEGIEAKAKKTGASTCVVKDLRKQFLEEFVWPMVVSGSVYEGKYLLGTSIARPIIARAQVEVALKTGCDALAHGCTGKGNDQVRFEVGTRSLAPDLEVIAPVRGWGMTREDSIHYAYDHQIPIVATKEKVYSIDDNLWGRAIECGEMEDPWARPPADIWELTAEVTDAPRERRDVVVTFEAGVPVALDGQALPLYQLVEQMTQAAGAYGYGRLDMVENRRVGIKSRETYEAPGSLALITAHQDLESITVERDLAREKARLEPRYAELVYDGLWFSPLKKALDAFVDSSQEFVTGEVRLTLEAGRCYPSGRRAVNGLYDYELATYDAADAFRHEDAAGFVRLWGLSVETVARRQGGLA